jgi:hypothetical protein
MESVMWQDPWLEKKSHQTQHVLKGKPCWRPDLDICNLQSYNLKIYRVWTYNLVYEHCRVEVKGNTSIQTL